MRVAISLSILCLLLVGCRTDPRCSRQTALLRAEILDLEDKYFLLKSQYESNLGERSSYRGVSSDGTMLSSDPIVGDAYYGDQYGDQYSNQYDGEMIYQGDVILDGANYGPAESYSNGYSDGEVIYDGGMVYGDVPVSVPVADGSLSNNAPANTLIMPGGSQLRSSANQTDPGEGSGQAELDQIIQLDAATDELNSLLPEMEESGNEVGGIALTGPNQEIGFDQSDRQMVRRGDITEVVINRDASRGHDVDGQPGDEGIDLLIQPRSADGSIELVGGELTVSVLDPNETTERQRIGLWKFLPGETELFFANDELGSHGILLHLPWEQSTPVNERLIIHVRFVTPDGRVMTTSSEIRIVPPGADYSADDPLVAGWTKRDSRWDSNLNANSRRPTKSSLLSSSSDWRRQRQPGFGRPQSGANSGGLQSASQFRSRGGSGSGGSIAVQNQFDRATATQQISQPMQSEFSLGPRVRAIPAKASIQRPAWRPVR